MTRRLSGETVALVVMAGTVAAFAAVSFTRLTTPKSTSQEFRFRQVDWAAGPESIDRRESSLPTALRLVFAGDIMQHRAQASDDFRACYAPIANFLSESDLTIGNLEFPVDPLRPVGPPVDSTQFNGSVAHLAALSGAGFDLLSTANNHSFDQGLDGTVSTNREIARQGMLPFGTLAGPEQEEPLVVERKGIRIGFCAYTFRPNSYPGPDGKTQYWNRDWPIQELNFADWTGEYRAEGKEVFRRHVAAAQVHRVDWLVAFVHWGREWQFYPTEDQRLAAHDMVELGFDLVVGSHGHVLNPLEWYRDRLIAYSLGNLISDFRAAEARVGALLDLELGRTADGRLVIAHFGTVPVVVERPGHVIRPVKLRNDSDAAYRSAADRSLGPACRWDDASVLEMGRIGRIGTDPTNEMAKLGVHRWSQGARQSKD